MFNLLKEHKEKLEKWKKMRINKQGLYNTHPKKPITLKRQVICNFSLYIKVSDYYLQHFIVALQTAHSTSQTSPTYMDVAPAMDEKFWENMQGSNWFSSDNINYAMFILSRQYPSIDGLGNCEFLSHSGTYTTTPTPAQRFIQIINVNNNSLPADIVKSTTLTRFNSAIRQLNFNQYLRFKEL